jgi:NADPH-dependent 2,4-dienoyl-CoA reductase/sulfur reductase-like enzyme
MDRRSFTRFAAAGVGTALIAGAPAVLAGARPRVVIIGGGFGGATLARYLRLWDPGIEVVLIERQRHFVSCPMSNLVLSGDRTLEQNTHGYEALARRGVTLLRSDVEAVDHARREVVLAGSQRVFYDRLVLSPGIDFLWDTVAGMNETVAGSRVPHAWKAGPQTTLLRSQLEAMEDGGTYILSIPKAPYRCPPGPYERVSLVASYFKRSKPRSRVLVLDANPEIVSKKGLFMKAWSELYPGIVDYQANAAVVEVDPAAGLVRTDFDSHQGQVLNVIVPHGAGRIAHQAGVVNVDKRWAGIDFRTYESTAVPGIHVIGDATSAAPTPKSAHTANNQAKICASALIAALRGSEPTEVPVSANTCYSFVSPTEAVHVAAVYRYDPGKRALVTAEGTAGVSATRSEAEAAYARAWAENIWADALS